MLTNKLNIPQDHIDQLRTAKSTMFFKPIKARGARLYKDGAVGEPIYSAAVTSYTAIVTGSKRYTVVLKMSKFSSTPILMCNCPFDDNCKHQMALIEKLLKESTNVKTKNNTSKIISIKPKAMKRASANQWRVIPGLDKVSDMNKVIGFLSESNNYYNPSDLEITFNTDNTYLVSWTSYLSRYYEATESIIELKKEKGQISTRCHSCQDISNKLCSHQSQALESLDKFLELMIDNKLLSYTDLLETVSNQTNLRPDQVEKYYSLIFNESYAFKSKTNAFIDSKTERYINDKIANNQSHHIRNRFDQLSTHGYALAWNDEGVDILTGKTNKTRTKLSSHIKVLDGSSVLDKKLQTFKNKIEQHSSYFDVAAIIESCRINIDLICEHINYHNTSEYEIRKSDLKPLSIKKEFIKTRVKIQHDGLLTIVHAELFLEDEIISMDRIKSFLPWLVILDKTIGHFFNNEHAYNLINLFTGHNGEIVITKDVSLRSPVYTLLANADEVIKEGFELQILNEGKKEIFLNKSGSYMDFVPKLAYDQEKFEILSSVHKKDLVTNTNFAANTSEVDQYKTELKELFAAYDIEVVDKEPIILNESDILTTNFMQILEYCSENNIEILGDEDVLFTKYTSKKANFNITFSSGIDWFDSNIEMAFGDIEVTPSQWVEAVKNNKSYIVLSDGKRGILPEKWLKKLKKLSSVGEIDKKGNIKINKLKFNVLDDMFEDIDDDALKEEIKQKKLALANYEENKSYKLPRGLKAKLRPYQKQGYQWLKFLEEYNFGGCLADDMGLGKTVQVLTLLLDQKKNKKGTSFIIVPRSLLFNWQSEIEKFTPTLKVHIHHGINRKFDSNHITKQDLIITTYDTCVRDIEVFSEIHFNYIILDESQAIKNPNSKRYKAMRLLKAHHRLVMTGTPIENNTLDLYAQFSFVNPGLLGSLNSFKNKFARNIDVNNDTDAKETLKKLLYPFILRRKKEDVAKDLPKKTESILYCEMDRTQRAMYEELKTSIRKDINSTISKDGINKSKFKILDGLLRLRQMCNATQLTSKNLPAAKNRSVKIDMLIDQINELGAHKALVFSQFVGMLTLVRERLDAEGIKYAYLDGSTRDRQKAVSDFMEDDTCNLFLISIKAGNSGLNLTKADYVYILDPWWNPAVEAQAIDRTHRIGQDKPVFAYKMICKDTIEEKIITLQTKKKQLASDLVQSDENVFKSLGKDELMTLFD